MKAESIQRCMFGANLVVLAQICDELSNGPAEFPRILSQNGQIDLEGQDQFPPPPPPPPPPPFSITAESIPGCIFGAYLVILTWVCDELSCEQTEFPRILWRKWPPFLIQMWWFQLISATSYHADKQNVTDGRTDGQTDGRTDRRADAGYDNTEGNTSSVWMAKG